MCGNLVCVDIAAAALWIIRRLSGAAGSGHPAAVAPPAVAAAAAAAAATAAPAVAMATGVGSDTFCLI